MDFLNSILFGPPDNSDNQSYVDELCVEEGEHEEEETDDHWIVRTLLDDIISYVCHVHDNDELEEEEWYEEYSCSSCSELSSSTETMLSSESIDARVLNWKLWLRRHEAQIQSIIKRTRRPICDVLMANLDEVYRIFMIKRILMNAEREKNWNVLFWKMPEQLKYIPHMAEVFAPFPKNDSCDKSMELIDVPTKDICERRLRKQSWLMSKYLEEKLRKMNIKLPNFEDLELTGTQITKPDEVISTFQSILASTELLGEEEEEDEATQMFNYEEELDCITFQLRANDLMLCGRYNNIEINLAYNTCELDRQVQTIKFQNCGRVAIRFNFKEIHPPYDVFYYNRNNFKLITEQCRDFDVFFQPTGYGLYTEHIQIEMNSGNSVTINLFGYCSIGIPEMRAEFEGMKSEMLTEISQTVVKHQLEEILKKSHWTEYHEKNYEIFLTPENLWNLKNPQYEYDLEIADAYVTLYNEINEIQMNLKCCNKWNYDLEELYTAILNVEDEEQRTDLYQKFCSNFDRMRTVKRLPMARFDEKIFKVRTLLVSLFDTFGKIAIDLKVSTKQSIFDTVGGGEVEEEYEEEDEMVVLHTCDLDRDSCQNIEVSGIELNKSKYAIYLQSLHLQTFHLLYTAIDDIVNAIESTNIRN